MPTHRLVVSVCLALIAFAGNSLFARLALIEPDIHAVHFTTLRLASGALVLLFLCRCQSRSKTHWSDVLKQPDWLAALMLGLYATSFSIAYNELTTATGALLLFTAVQITMVSYGLKQGERLSRWQWLGFNIAIVGLILLLLPNTQAPSLNGAVMMFGSGIAWAIYTIRGKSSKQPIASSAKNFLYGLVLTIPLLFFIKTDITPSGQGILYAILSGALTSGLGYAIWYGVLPAIKSTTAASLQLSVPAIAALMGAMVLSETLSLQAQLSGLAILGGIGLIISLGQSEKNHSGN